MRLIYNISHTGFVMLLLYIYKILRRCCSILAQREKPCAPSLRFYPPREQNAVYIIYKKNSKLRLSRGLPRALWSHCNTCYNTSKKTFSLSLFSWQVKTCTQKKMRYAMRRVREIKKKPRFVRFVGYVLCIYNALYYTRDGSQQSKKDVGEKKGGTNCKLAYSISRTRFPFFTYYIFSLYASFDSCAWSFIVSALLHCTRYVYTSQRHFKWRKGLYNALSSE